MVRTTPSAKKTPVATPTPATNNSGIVVPTMPWTSKGTDGNTSWGKPINPASTRSAEIDRIMRQADLAEAQAHKLGV